MWTLICYSNTHMTHNCTSLTDQVSLLVTRVACKSAIVSNEDSFSVLTREDWRIYVIVNFLSQVIFIFLLFLGMKLIYSLRCSFVSFLDATIAKKVTRLNRRDNKHNPRPLLIHPFHPSDNANQKRNGYLEMRHQLLTCNV